MLLIVLMGAHWLTLQSAAWVSMAVNYSQQSNLPEALAKTFDGEHPCDVCLAVQEGKQADKESEALTVTLKLEFICTPEEIRIFPPSLAHPLDAATLVGISRKPAPPYPPPRSFVS